MMLKAGVVLIVGLLWTGEVSAKEELLDRVVAKVDSDLVLESELISKVKDGPLVRVSDYPSPENSDERTKALNDAINVILVLRRVEELDIRVKDEEVDNQVNQILKDSNLTRDALFEYLRRQNKTFEQYRQDLKEQMLFMRFKGRVIVPTIKISNADVEAYYLNKQGSNPDAAELSLRKLVIAGSDNHELLKEKEKLANEIYEKLKLGLSFEEAQKIYGVEGSDRTVQVFKLRDLDSQIRSQLQNLKAREFSTPVKTSFGLVIFYVEDRKLVGSQDFLRQKDELERELHIKEVLRHTNLWLQTERERSKIVIIKE